MNIEYNHAFNKVSKVLQELSCILKGDEEHRLAFKNLPIVGFSNGKSLKNILVRAVLPKLKNDTEKGCSGCKNVRCQVCDLIVDAKDFTSTKTGEKFSIEKGGLDCNSDHIVYLITCKVCQIQNVGSTKSDKARKRFNNYKSGQRKVREKILGEVTEKSKRGRPADENKIHQKSSKFEKKFSQEKFHLHFCGEGHKGIEDWDIRLIDSAHSEKALRKKELFWQYKLKTFHPDGLNEIEAIIEAGS